MAYLPEKPDKNLKPNEVNPSSSKKDSTSTYSPVKPSAPYEGADLDNQSPPPTYGEHYNHPVVPSAPLADDAYQHHLHVIAPTAERPVVQVSKIHAEKKQEVQAYENFGNPPPYETGGHLHPVNTPTSPSGAPSPPKR